MSLHRAKYAAERALIASGLQWTIIRPAAYLETWIPIIGAKIADKGQAVVFGPGRNPINFVSADDVAAIVGLALHDQSPHGQILAATGPQNLTFTHIADRLIADSGRPARIKPVPLPMLRAMSVLARPFSPVLARQAQAAVVMNTTDAAALHRRFSLIPMTTLNDVLTRQHAHHP